MNFLKLFAAGILLMGAACTPKEPVVMAPKAEPAETATVSEPAAPMEKASVTPIVVDGDPLEHPNRILDAEEYYKLVAGQTTTNGKGTFTFNPDRTITGSGVTSDGITPFTFSANYSFENGFYCRSNSIFNGKSFPDDCQVVIVEGDSFALFRNRGTGDRADYWFVR